MHGSKKQTVLIICLFCLLFVIAGMPVALLDYSRYHMLGQLRLSSAQPVSVAEYQAPETKNAFFRLLLTQKASVQSDSIILAYRSEANGQKQAPVQSLEAQLALLQENGSLPPLSFSSEYEATFLKITYMDMDKPGSAVNLWQISIEYPTMYILATMDMDLSLLYEVSVYSETSFLYDAHKASAKGFLQYLTAQAGDLEVNGERFEANGYYTVNSAQLSLVSYNNDTRQVTQYHFSQFSTPVTYEIIESVP